MASLVSLSRFPRAVSFIGRRGRSASRSMSLFHPFATPGSFNPTMSRLNVGAKPKQNRLFFSSKLNNTSKNAVNKVESSAAADTGETASQETMSTWQRFLAPKPMPERQTAAWYRELLLICTVFGITGSSTMLLVRPAVSNGLGINGSFRDGPWSYRLCSIVIMTPIYATLLVAVGTVFGRHAYFRHFSVKIFSRFGIPPEALDKNFHETKKTFRKW